MGYEYKDILVSKIKAAQRGHMMYVDVFQIEVNPD